MKNKRLVRYHVVRSCKADPWGKGIFLRRRLFLKFLHQYYEKIKNMRKKKNYKNVLLLDASRGKIKKRIKRKSLYGRMLMNKQKLQAYYYNFRNYQLRQLVFNSRMLGKINFWDSILRNLELRVDAVLFRSNFSPSLAWTRQLVSHKNFFLHEKKVNHCHDLLNIFDIISVQKKPAFYYNLEKTFRLLKKNLKPVPNHLLIDYKSLRILVLSVPSTNEIFYPFKSYFSQLVQFYQIGR